MTPEQFCKSCNCSIFDKKNNNRLYCSNKCQQKERRRKKAESGFIAVVSLKKYLIEVRGLQCEICKINSWCEKPVPLVMDHIDGNSDNNILSNLRLVCGNCDMQLPTYKSKNKGNGRYYRRLRYKNKKSF